jgi:hypothetical protein
MIVEYKRKGRPLTKEGKMGTSNARAKKGVMIALPDEEKGAINFGFSLCCFRQNEKDVDEFDPNFGKKLAIERALTVDRPLCIPCSMAKQFARFVERCGRYYKQLSLKREIIYTAQEMPSV